jgi:hypothetical protein
VRRKNMELSKMANIGGKWVRIALTRQEFDRAMAELVQLNLRELERIREILKENQEPFKQDAERLLFEKQGISAYTYLINKVDEKIEKQKQNIYEEAPTRQPPKPLKPVFKEDNPFESNNNDGSEVEASDVGIEGDYEEIKMPEEKKKGFFR